MNNSSFFTADRMTHVKIVVVSLVASIAVIVVSIAARAPSIDTMTARVQTGPVVKATKTITVTTTEQKATIR
jgi:hypothetical protein